MWRAEENIFARTRPARLDSQYSHTSACATSPPASALMPPRWFHVPGSGARDVQASPEGLVASVHLSSSLLQQRSSLLDHRGAADASARELVWDGRDTDGSCCGNTGPSMVTQQRLPTASCGGVGTRSTRSLSSPLRHPHTRPAHDTSTDDASSEVSRLLRHYRGENARLREQLKAKELHEAHIMAKLEETSHRYAHLQLAWQRATREMPGSLFLSVDDNAGAVQSVDSGGGKAQAMVQSLLAQREAEVRELQGRVDAYREALQRSRAHAALLAEERPAAPAPCTCCAGSSASVSPTSLHVLLLQSLNTADYLVKVFNALQHCNCMRHGDAHDSDSGSGCCRRNLHDCKLRCLQAAMKGAPISPELLELEDGPENDTAAANMETAVGVREELLYCEAMAVRLAASLLGRERFADDDAAQPVTTTATTAPSEQAASLPSPVAPGSPGALEVVAPVAVAKAAVADAHGGDGGEESAGESERNSEEDGQGTVSYATAAREPRRRPSRCRPDIDDCEVQ